GVARGVAELALDAEEAVVLGDPLGARRGAGLDLARPGPDDEVGDRRVLGLARAVRDDGGPSRGARHLDRVERLGQRADLVELDEDGVRGGQLETAGAALGV